MKTLLAIISCHSRPQYREAQRDTWIPLIPKEADYRFFMGPSTDTPKEDEVLLDCDDSYQGLPSKVQAVVLWALYQGYDYVVKVDDDVVLWPTRFMNSGYNNYDFTGHTNEDRSRVTAPWGFCYVLSRKAMEHIAAATLPYGNNDEVWVANTLAAQGITLHNEPRYCLHRGKRQDFIAKTPRPLRAPPRVVPMDVDTPAGGIAYCVYLNWAGFHATPDEVNIKTFHKVFKETQ